MSQKAKVQSAGDMVRAKRGKSSPTPKAQKPQVKTPKSPAKVQKVEPKAVRLCGACQGQVAQRALYCRHCGKPLSAEVPPNPHLPPPPKPWRPSRIPRHQPSTSSVPVLPPVETPVIESSTDQAPVPPVQVVPKPDPLWAPIPEIETRMTHLQSLHERLKPMLARTSGVKSRLRSPGG